MPHFPPNRNALLFAVLITAMAALFHESGTRLFENYGHVAMLHWLAAGMVTTSFFRWIVPWVPLGCFGRRLKLPASWAWTLLPFLHAAEQRLASFPGTIITGAATSPGLFTVEDLFVTIARIATSQIPGMLAVGLLAAHLLRRDFNSAPREGTFSGVVVMTSALALMVFTFSDFLGSVLGIRASSYIPFPLIILVGVTCRPPLAALFIALWCLGTTVLTSMGTGPFSRAGGWGPLLELGIYNLVVCSTAYLLSIGSTRYKRQVRRNALTMEAAGVEMWEWNARRGLHSHSLDEDSSRVKECIGGLAPLPALALLACGAGGDPDAIPEHWKRRLETGSSTAGLLMSVGRVTSRNRDGVPQGAIGMLQDLSAIKAAEEALVALGHQRAQLRSLQTRLNPHFLFNALNAIRALIHLDPVKASAGVTTLARLLRANLRNTDRPLIPLAEEMGIVEDLLAVAKTRFGDRLTIRISVATDAEDALVPPMLVFNLVENALVHGIEKSSEAGIVTVVAKLRDQELVISVSNPGRLDSSSSPGVGTRDAKQRLQLIFGSLGRFRMFQSNESTVLAEVIVPFRDYESAHC